MNASITSLHVFKTLLLRDFQVFKKIFWGKQIDVAISVAIFGFVNGHLLTRLGLSESYGAFYIVSSIATVAFFEVYGDVWEMSSDLIGQKIITYDLTLPLSPRLVFIRQAISWAIRSFTMSLCVLPIGKLLLWSTLDLSRACWSKLILMMVLLNVCFGFLTLLFVAYATSFNALMHLWCRVIFPLWTLGAATVSWQTMHAASKGLGYLILLDPVTYAMEGVRIATLGQEGSLPFWLCCAALIGFTYIFAWLSVKKLSQRLDVMH